MNTYYIYTPLDLRREKSENTYILTMKQKKDKWEKEAIHDKLYIMQDKTQINNSPANGS